MHCPTINSFTYNSTLCACNPGYLYNASTARCSPSTLSVNGEFMVGTGVDYSINFPETILSFESIKKYTQSQWVFIGATFVSILSWFLFCFFVRFRELGDGRSYWFKIRWWVSRLDVCFSTQHWLHAVGFLADLGGLYCVSISLFFFCLVQFEYRFKRFRHEDKVMRRIRNRRIAQDRWDKLRKYVIFTWGRASLPPEEGTIMETTCCCSGTLMKSRENEGSSKRRHHIRKDTISFNRKISIPDAKMFSPEQVQTDRVACCFRNSTSIPQERFSCQVSPNEGSGNVNNDDAPKQQPSASAANDIPLPPSVEIKPGSEVSTLEIQKNLENLYENNVRLREELILAQSMLHTLTSKDSASKEQ